MIRWKRSCAILIACGILLLVGGPARWATGSPLAGTSVRIQDDLFSLPSIFSKSRYNVDPYLRVAAALQASGHQNARRALLSLARQDTYVMDMGDGRSRSMPRNPESGVFILCRMLFVSKEKTAFRSPWIGAQFYPGGTSDTDWPLDPIELVDGIPFVLPMGCMIAGMSESPLGYLRYCLHHCKWNPYRFRLKSAQEKQQALKKLFASSKWKEPLSESDRDFFSNQIQ